MREYYYTFAMGGGYMEHDMLDFLEAVCQTVRATLVDRGQLNTHLEQDLGELCKTMHIVHDEQGLLSFNDIAFIADSPVFIQCTELLLEQAQNSTSAQEIMYVVADLHKTIQIAL